MIVSCESCKSRYKLDDAKITGRGAKITCPKCKHVFVVFAQAPTVPGASPAPSASPAPNEWEDAEPTRIGKMPVEIRNAEQAKPPPPATTGNVSVHEVVRVPSPAVDPTNAPTMPPMASPIAPPSKDAAARAAGLDFRKVGVTAWKVKVKIGLVYDFSDIKTLRKYITDGRVTPADVISHDGKAWKPIGEIPDLDAFFVEMWEKLNAEQIARGDTPKEGPAIQDLGKLAAELAASASAEIARQEANPRSGPTFRDPFEELKAKQRERANQRGRNAAQKDAKKSGDRPAWMLPVAAGLIAALSLGWYFTRNAEVPPAAASVTKGQVKPGKGPKKVDGTAPAPDGTAAGATQDGGTPVDVKQWMPVPDEPSVKSPNPVATEEPCHGPGGIEIRCPTAPPPSANVAAVKQPLPGTGAPPPSSAGAQETTAKDHEEIGDGAARSKDWATAVKAYGNAVKAGASSSTIYRKLGEAQLRGGNADGALVNLKMASDKGDKSATCLMGEALESVGDTSGASTAYTTCLKGKPSNAAEIQARLAKLGGG